MRAALLFFLPVLALAQEGTYLVDSFSGEASEGLPKGWKPLVFKKIPPTRYSLHREGDGFYLRAESSGSASGIYKEVPVSLKDYPILSWRWRIGHVLKKADATKKSGDDYPARIYLAFAYDPGSAGPWEKAGYGLARRLYGSYPPKAALNYVWDNRLPVGSVLDNAYTERAKMVVVESGDGKAGLWVAEERNAYEDYKKIFGKEPPKIAFIALMTDTDDTGESVSAGYDDILFKKKDNQGGQ